MCCHNVVHNSASDPRAHTKFMLHARPKPLCEVVYVKLLSQEPFSGSCDESEKVLLSVNLASFLVCACKFICHGSRACFFIFVCMCHTPIRLNFIKQIKRELRERHK
jgi:hypothetical protein